MKSFLELSKNLKKDFTGFPIVSIAILGDTATQLLVQAIKGYGYELGLNFDIFESDYNQIERQIFDQSSDFYKKNFDFVIIVQSAQHLIEDFYLSDTSQKANFTNNQITRITEIYDAIMQRHSCRIIWANFPEIDDSVFGNYSNKLEISFNYQLRKLNYELMNFSCQHDSFFINDISAIQNRYGYNFMFDPRMYVNASMGFSIDSLPLVAKNTVDIIQGMRGSVVKCIILDLDNTLWGGVIGDDGIENIQIGNLGIGKAFTSFQMWLKQLKERGILLAVCSKNTDSIAREPFEKHPDTVLKLADFVAFSANWNNKVDNIHDIQKMLNIGFDSMVFVDDSPFEREMVKTHIPDIVVPEMPQDPAEYVSYLRSLNLFETASYSEIDSSRTEQYQTEGKRKSASKVFANEDEFLSGLEMKCEVKQFIEFDYPRIAQLTQRSNQFNLRTVRYSEEDIRVIASSDRYYTLSFTLRDKFGGYGMISIVILEKKKESLFIDTWIMSCRVLKRGVEKLVLDYIVDIAKSHNHTNIIGEYIPTAKNGLVKDHYPNLGFQQDKGHYILSVEQYTKLRYSISVDS